MPNYKNPTKLQELQELKNLGWNCLENTKPPQLTFCEWVFVGDTYTEQGMGVYYTGVFGSISSGFCDYRGAFISDPIRTYWKKIKK